MDAYTSASSEFFSRETKEFFPTKASELFDSEQVLRFFDTSTSSVQNARFVNHTNTRAEQLGKIQI